MTINKLTFYSLATDTQPSVPIAEVPIHAGFPCPVDDAQMVPRRAERWYQLTATTVPNRGYSQIHLVDLKIITIFAKDM